MTAPKRRRIAVGAEVLPAGAALPAVVYFSNSPATSVTTALEFEVYAGEGKKRRELVVGRGVRATNAD